MINEIITNAGVKKKDNKVIPNNLLNEIAETAGVTPAPTTIVPIKTPQQLQQEQQQQQQIILKYMDTNKDFFNGMAQLMIQKKLDPKNIQPNQLAELAKMLQIQRAQQAQQSKLPQPTQQVQAQKP